MMKQENFILFGVWEWNFIGLMNDVEVPSGTGYSSDHQDKILPDPLVVWGRGFLLSDSFVVCFGF